MKRFIAIILLICIVSIPITTIASDDMFVYDLGDGNFVATQNKEIGEWIVAFHYWLQGVTFFEYDDSCPNSGDF